jgi:hypothetical protein
MEHSVEYADVQALFDTGLSVVCLVDGIRVRVPRVLIQSGSEVRRHGDHGKLVIPKWFAISVGLAHSEIPRTTPPWCVPRAFGARRSTNAVLAARRRIRTTLGVHPGERTPLTLVARWALVSHRFALATTALAEQRSRGGES